MDPGSLWAIQQGLREMMMGQLPPTASTESYANTQDPPSFNSARVVARAGARTRARGRGTKVQGRGYQTGPGGASELAPPVNLVDTHVEQMPTPAEESARPELLGEQGGSKADPRRTFNLQQTASLTVANPRSVDPQSMGLSDATRAGQRAAISTQHTPDMGVESAAMERAKQLPSTAGYVQRDAALALQAKMSGSGLFVDDEE